MITRILFIVTLCLFSTSAIAKINFTSGVSADGRAWWIVDTYDELSRHLYSVAQDGRGNVFKIRTVGKEIKIQFLGRTQSEGTPAFKLLNRGAWRIDAKHGGRHIYEVEMSAGNGAVGIANFQPIPQLGQVSWNPSLALAEHTLQLIDKPISVGPTFNYDVNLVGDEIELTLQNASEKVVQFELTDLLGRVIGTSSAIEGKTRIKLNESNIEGSFFLRASSGHAVKTQKLLLSR